MKNQRYSLKTVCWNKPLHSTFSNDSKHEKTVTKEMGEIPASTLTLRNSRMKKKKDCLATEAGFLTI